MTVILPFGDRSDLISLLTFAANIFSNALFIVRNTYGY